MAKPIWWIVPVAVVAAAVGASLYYKRQSTPPETPKTTAPLQASAEPPIQHPVPEQTRAEPLPTLDESDGPLQQRLAKIFDPQMLSELLVPKDIVRHAVVTIDNLPRSKVAVQMRPIKPPGGEFLVSESGDVATISPKNAERYRPVVRMLQAADAKVITDAYFHYYPLFQQAYVDLGYPSGYFNDRLVEVIDHLLATPEVKEPIRLVQPSVYYQFADPELEKLSAGQKALLRMGAENTAAVKAKLREIRGMIVMQPRRE